MVESGVSIRAKHGGFFVSLVNPGDIVSNGQVIGKIFNPFGQLVEDVKAIINGVVWLINFRAPKFIGDVIFSINKIVS